MDASGSPLFALTWSEWDMPAGPPICRLRASARRIADNDFGSWPTPCANEDNKSPEAHLAMKQRMGERDGTGANRTAITSLQVMAKTVALVSWPTPQASDGRIRGDGQLKRTGGRRRNLDDYVTLASWATPRVGNNGGHGNPIRATDGKARLEDQVHGVTSSGSPAPTAKRGQLNPAFSLWLQGYPTAWLSSAPQATRSSRKLRQSS
jgi:hypothetical protein